MNSLRAIISPAESQTRDDAGQPTQSYVRVARWFVPMSGLATAAYAPVLYLGGFTTAAIVVLVVGVMHLLIYPLLWLGQQDLARAFPVLLQSVLITWLSCTYGADSLIPLSCFTLLFLPPLMFAFEEYRWMIGLEMVIMVAMATSLVGGQLPDPSVRIATVMPMFPVHELPLNFGVSVYLLALIISDLRERQNRLRQEVRVRRAAEIEARNARRAAENASRAKAEFVATVSHEIRTPLTGVLGMTDLLAETALSTRQRDMLRVIHGSGEHLRMIIEDILDFSKIDANELSLSEEPFYLGRLVEETVESLVVAGTDPKVALVLDLDLHGDLELRGDADRLRQVLINLFSNAIKFTPQGWIEARVTAEVIEGVARVHLEVEDTGVGVPPDRREQIFEPFSQIEPNDPRRPGTGLGLTISRRLMVLMGGSLDLTSVPDEGSTFHATVGLRCTGNTLPEHDLEGLRVGVFSHVPRRAAALRNALGRMNARVAAVSDLNELAGRGWDVVIADASHPAVKRREVSDLLGLPERRVLMLHPIMARGDEPSMHYPCSRAAMAAAVRGCLSAEVNPSGDLADDARFEGVHALVAEDNPVNQMVIRGFLNHFGITCDMASDGREACEAFDARKHQLVFMDVQMPLVTGIDATMWIRSHVDQDATIPIIATTAYALHETDDEALTRGFDDYLTKPLRKSALLSVLRRHVRHAEVAETVAH